MDESDLAINPLLPILDVPNAETPPLLDAATAAARHARDAIFFVRCCRVVCVIILMMRVVDDI